MTDDIDPSASEKPDGEALIAAGETAEKSGVDFAARGMLIDIGSEQDAPVGECASDRVQRRLHLGGMMAVVIDDARTPAAFQRQVGIALEATAHAAELVQRL